VPVVAKPERVASVSPSGIDVRLEKAVSMISPDVPYDQWLRVGQAIHHETDGNPDGLALWDVWSSHNGGCDSYPGFEELEAKWETFGRSSAQPVTAGTIYKMATEAGWIDTPSADDFEVIADSDAGIPASVNPRFNILPWAEFAVAKPFTWLIKQVMPKAALIVIYGPPGGGKSFWVLDAVNSIARGSRWRGKKVNQGGVLYICAEGAGGFRNRLTAYARHHNVDPTMPVYVLGDAPNLINKSDTPALLKAVEGLGPLSVIVVDTFAQVTPGSNENSSEGAGLALKNCRMLHEKTGATVILVAHSGKDATKGVRGWSGIKGACDCEIEITRVEDSDIRIAAITKQKDGEDQEQKYPFKLVTIPVGQDEDGDPVTSCYVEHTDEIPDGREKKPKIGENEKVLLDAVETYFTENNEWPDVDALLNSALELMPESKTKPAGRKYNLGRALKALCEREILEEKGGFVSLMNGNFSPVQDLH
jgi:RecA-family ATPase